MRLKRPFASVLLCLAVLLPTLSFAASVAELQTARDNAFRAATQMLMFVALDKAIERRVIAEKAIANVDATVAGLNDVNLLRTLANSPYLADHQPRPGWNDQSAATVCVGKRSYGIFQ